MKRSSPVLQAPCAFGSANGSATGTSREFDEKLGCFGSEDIHQEAPAALSRIRGLRFPSQDPEPAETGMAGADLLRLGLWQAAPEDFVTLLQPKSRRSGHIHRFLLQPQHHLTVRCASQAPDALAAAAVQGDGAPSSNASLPLSRSVVAYTTPKAYAYRLHYELAAAGATPIWCPTIVTDTTPATRQEIINSIWSSGGNSIIEQYHGIAFTSRAGIEAVATALDRLPSPLPSTGPPFFLAALGSDMDLLRQVDLFPGNPRRVYLHPPSATPSSLVKALGAGMKRRILCPVPLVSSLKEPPVIPAFLRSLSQAGWQPRRVNAYLTSWAGPDPARFILGPGPHLSCNALIFTSTAEVEGLLKSLGISPAELSAIAKSSGCVLAAHGPVTARGAADLGVKVDFVGTEFHSFEGVVTELAQFLSPGPV